jgi:hypothetical protein
MGLQAYEGALGVLLLPRVEDIMEWKSRSWAAHELSLSEGGKITWTYIL